MSKKLIIHDNRILCHIAGMNEEIKEDFYNLMNQKKKIVEVVDLDKMSDKIINDKYINRLHKKLEFYKSKKNSKSKEIQKEMNDYWKKKLDNFVDDTLNKTDKNKKIIFVGLVTHYKYTSKKIKIKTNNKFFLKVNHKKNAKSVIKYNIDNYRKEIIEGTFPLKYLDMDFLVKKRILLERQYYKMNYVSKSLKNILKMINLNLDKALEFKNIKKLYIGMKDKYNEGSLIYPFNRGKVIAYSEKWLALTSVLGEQSKKFRKGYADNKPYIEEKEKNAIRAFNTNGYLYEVAKDNFIFHEKGKTYKLVSQNPAAILKRTYISNIYKKLNDSSIKYKKFKN